MQKCFSIIWCFNHFILTLPYYYKTKKSIKDEHQNTYCCDELPRICCLGSISHVYGQLFGQSRNGSRNCMVLCHSGHCLYLYANHRGHCCWQICATAAHVRYLPSVGRLRYGRPVLSWHDQCTTRQDDIHSNILAQRGFLYAYASSLVCQLRFMG